jgi:hypothetical protein
VRAVDPGLCGICRHARVVETRNGSRFHLCELSKVLPAFPRYPPLPVLRCGGFQNKLTAEAAEAGTEDHGE